MQSPTTSTTLFSMTVRWPTPEFGRSCPSSSWISSRISDTTRHKYGLPVIGRPFFSASILPVLAGFSSNRSGAISKTPKPQINRCVRMSESSMRGVTTYATRGCYSDGLRNTCTHSSAVQVFVRSVARYHGVHRDLRQSVSPASCSGHSGHWFFPFDLCAVQPSGLAVHVRIGARTSGPSHDGPGWFWNSRKERGF